MKKGEHSRFRDDDKDKREASPRDEDRTSQRSPGVIEEIKTITGRPSIGGSFKSYQRQVNNVHRMPPMNKDRQIGTCFSWKKMLGK